MNYIVIVNRLNLKGRGRSQRLLSFASRKSAAKFVAGVDKKFKVIYFGPGFSAKSKKRKK